jgi:hypothetical protein
VLAYNDFTGEKLLAHLQHYYQWNAGLDANNYVTVFQTFNEMYRQAPYYDKATIDRYASRVEPFVFAHPNPSRDFLRLGVIPPDLLIFFGLAGFIVISRRDKRIIAIVILLMALDYAASLSAGLLGDNRYAHLLWPFYLVGGLALIEWMIAKVAVRRIDSPDRLIRNA